MHRTLFLLAAVVVLGPTLACAPQAGDDRTAATSAFSDLDVLAAWTAAPASAAPDRTLLRVDALDAHLLSQPGAQRQPGEGQAVDAWIEGHVQLLFERSALLAPAAVDALVEDAGFAATYARQLRTRLSRMHLQRNNARFDVTVEDARAHFDANRARFKRPERRAFRNLLLAFPGEADDAARDAICARAAGLRAEIVAGASFEAMVYAHSMSENAASGGQVGPVTRSDLRGSIGEIIFALEPGAVSEVARTRVGCQLFQVINIAPATDPTFALMQEPIVRQLADAERTRWWRAQLDAEAARVDLTLPTWIDDPRAPMPEPDAEVMRHALPTGETIAITGRDLRQHQVPGTRPAGVLQSLLGEHLFAHATRREQPDAARAVAETIRSDLAYAALRQQALVAHLDTVPDDALQAHHAQNRDVFQSDPELELTVYSWPIGDADPLRVVARPRALIADLERGTPPEQAWTDRVDADVDEGRRQRLPRASIRALGQRHPELAKALFQDVSEGRVIGPLRYANRLYAVHVNAHIPSRPLSFLEARDGVRQHYAQQNADALQRAWFDALAAQHDYALHDAAIARFGETLVDRLLGAPLGAGASDASPDATRDG